MLGVFQRAHSCASLSNAALLSTIINYCCCWPLDMCQDAQQLRFDSQHLAFFTVYLKMGLSCEVLEVWSCYWSSLGFEVLEL